MLSEFSQILRFWPSYMNYQVLLVYEIDHCREFSKISRKYCWKISQFLKFSHCSWVLSEYSQGLRILPPNLTSQIVVVIEKWRFFIIFSKNFQKFDFKNSKTLKVSSLLLNIVNVLPGVANLVSDYGCSSPCSFRDMTFFSIFFKIFQKTKI